MEPRDELFKGLQVELDQSLPGIASHDSEGYGFSGYGQFMGRNPGQASVPLRYWGVPDRVDLKIEESEAQQSGDSPITSVSEKQPKPPKWLEGTYRPKALTEAGALALNLLGPGAEGLSPVPSTQLSSLVERRRWLAMRYVALDLLQLGLVFEINGHYKHIDDLENRDTVGFWAKMKLTRSNSRMHEQDMLAMLAVGRMMSLDQIILAQPEHARNNAELLWAMESTGLVERHQVVHGKGKWEAYGLTDKSWRWLHREYPDLSRLGIKSRRPTGKNRDYHESLQVDALGWFQQELVDAGGVVRKIYLDRALRQIANQNGGGGYLDFRLYYRNALGLEGLEEIEVIGLGSSYRSRSRLDAIQHCAVHCSYSAGGHRIAMGSHVCIGR
jgi:hypothetical protein